MYEALDRLNVPAGTLLFAEGEVATVAYLIRSGTVEIFVTQDDQEVFLAVRGAGEIVGEMAIIDAGKRSASVRVKDDCDLVLVTRDQITHRLENTDPIIRMYLRTIIERLRNASANVTKYAVAVDSLDGTASCRLDFQKAINTLSIESELRRALKCSELRLFFQPIVRFDDYRLAGFEALIRWNHPTRGLISPSEFIPVAEASGLIVDVTSWCLGQIGEIFPKIMHVALSNTKSVAPLFMSVNVSGFDLLRSSFMNDLFAMLSRTAIPAEAIKLEITESVLMTDPQAAARSLVICRDRGVQISIDDFGTGFSSLSYLSALPISTIKIDRSFVSTMMADPKQMKIVLMILRLADELGFSVVAEGIEDAVQADTLKTLGCSYGQGYLFGKPLPLDQTLGLTRHWNAGGIESFTQALPKVWNKIA